MARPRRGGINSHDADKRRVDRALLQRHGVGDDNEAASDDAGAAKARNGPTDDERGRVGGEAADEGPNLEDGDCQQVRPLLRELEVDATVYGLERAGGDEVR